LVAKQGLVRLKPLQTQVEWTRYVKHPTLQKTPANYNILKVPKLQNDYNSSRKQAVCKFEVKKWGFKPKSNLRWPQ